MYQAIDGVLVEGTLPASTHFQESSVTSKSPAADAKMPATTP
jgi:hypothetical protein